MLFPLSAAFQRRPNLGDQLSAKSKAAAVRLQVGFLVLVDDPVFKCVPKGARSRSSKILRRAVMFAWRC